ncbi:MAG TPA: methylated-DNA--[protein]-cysteine S-methyltransferase [Actinomycetota bacterium]|nr:methylated-DNA--[protein]-cysteine S-methyltransferase [Actinomycetota bacterium]
MDTIFWDLIDSPIGRLLAGRTDAGVCLLSFGWEPFDGVHDPDALTDVREQLGEYFAGERTSFDLPLDLSLATGFTRRVLAETARIPYGEVRTYGQVAEAIGAPRAARAVGGALNRNPVGIVVPCHRVVGSSGSLVGFGGGLHRKERLLELEGALATA